jgi:hypothetical protein
MSGLDKLLNASVDAVKKSGALETNALMATVSVVNTNGTVDVTRAGDTFPSVRVLSGYMVPTVGDSVELLRSAGGWVCVGKLMTSSAPRFQTGSLSLTSATADSWSSYVTVTFPTPFASTPVVMVTCQSGGPTGTSELEFKLTAVSTTSFQVSQRRGTTSTTTVGWFATDF